MSSCCFSTGAGSRLGRGLAACLGLLALLPCASARGEASTLAAAESKAEVLNCADLPPLLASKDRQLVLASRDGWVAVFDMNPSSLRQERRVASSLEALALSSDGRWLLASTEQASALQLFDGRLQPVKTIALQSLDGRQRTRVAAIRDLPERRSFLVALQDLAEVWEISYDPLAEEVHDGLVHDYRMGEALGKPGFLHPRRTPLEAPVLDWLKGTAAPHIWLTLQPRAGGGLRLQLLHLDVRRAIASMPLSRAVKLSAGLLFERQGHPVLAVPAQDQGQEPLEFIELQRLHPPLGLDLPRIANAVGQAQSASLTDALRKLPWSQLKGRYPRPALAADAVEPADACVGVDGAES